MNAWPRSQSASMPMSRRKAMNAPVKFDDHTKLYWWQAALKGERRPITADEPMTGFYRARSKNKQSGEETLYAVAYWWHVGKCFCKVNAPGMVGVQPTLTGDKLQRMIASWPHVSKEPIAYDVYQAVVAGSAWPDQHVVEKAAPAAASMLLDAQSPTATTAGAVDQQQADPEPVDNSPQGILKRDIEAARAGIARYVTKGEDGKIAYLVDSDDLAGAAQSLRATFLKHANAAKKAREEANRPHNEAIRANGKIWTPLEDDAKHFADMLRDGPIKAWELQKRANAEAAAKAAAAASAASGTTVAPVSNTPAPSAKIKGATGKAASVTETKKAVIVDQDAVYAHFKDDLQVKAILQGLATAAVRAGITVPGTTVDKDVDIR